MNYVMINDKGEEIDLKALYALEGVATVKRAFVVGAAIFVEIMFPADRG